MLKINQKQSYEQKYSKTKAITLTKTLKNKEKKLDAQILNL